MAQQQQQREKDVASLCEKDLAQGSYVTLQHPLLTVLTGSVITTIASAFMVIAVVSDQSRAYRL